jgi:predicted enzyme related to lactoylglutathione lyase
MFKENHAFSGFAVADIDQAKKFYGETLGMTVTDLGMGGLISLGIAGGGTVMVYPKDDHQPATFTILNFPVPDVEAAVDQLAAKGVEFIHYDEENLKTDEKGIAGGDDRGPRIAWFKDPSGNILSVLAEDPSQA